MANPTEINSLMDLMVLRTRSPNGNNHEYSQNCNKTVQDNLPPVSLSRICQKTSKEIVSSQPILPVEQAVGRFQTTLRSLLTAATSARNTFVFSRTRIHHHHPTRRYVLFQQQSNAEAHHLPKTFNKLLVNITYGKNVFSVFQDSPGLTATRNGDSSHLISPFLQVNNMQV